MKNLYWCLLLFCLSLSLSGQRNADYGILAGVSSYIGDINPNRLFYLPLPAGGVFFRYNLNPRQSLRTSLLFGGLRANDNNFKNSFQIARDASFHGTLSEWNIQFEFNFLPYSTFGKRWNYTPYLAAGLGCSFISTTYSAAASVTTTKNAFIPVIPFSMGFKINIYKNLGLEAEYGFRKTFYDNFDGVKDLVASSDISLLHNNDWYSFAGVAVTWKIYSKLAGCPAFNDVDSKRKH